MKKILLLILLFLLIILGSVIYASRTKKAENNPTSSSDFSAAPPPPSSLPSQLNIPSSDLTLPIAQFKERITKKPYGIYISPQNSPVQPERFKGYHAAVDVEYEDMTEDVPVYAISDGKVVLSKTTSGYGGVFMIEINQNSKIHNVLYGHIRPSSLPKVGQIVNKGDKIAVLGTGFSVETDGERKHLHLAVLSDNRLDIRGYVQNQGELSGWIDPLSLYK